MAINPNSIRRVLNEEAAAITAFADQSESCIAAAQIILESKGMLVVSGIGKSGHIGNKIASTFRSLGKPAVYLHAAEASHGDLGLVQPGSVVLVLSNSGETSELSDLLHYCKVNKMQIIGITGGKDSTLAHSSDVAIVYDKVTEACHNGLAPTTSTTLALAIGDALAVAVSEAIGIDPEDFRRYHPGGKLGTHLMTVDQIMHKGNDLPLLTSGISMSETLVIISEKALGIGVFVEDNKVSSVITDGDLRRNVGNLLSKNPESLSSKEPFAIAPDWLVSDAVEFMLENEISVCVVNEKDGTLAGLLHMHDCVRTEASK